MSRTQPYKVDRLTGKSATREFVEAFLSQAFNNTDKGPPLIERLYSKPDSTLALLDNIYLHPARSPLLLYIGRAARVLDGHNPHEETWCLKADVTNACKRLDRKTRTVLGLRFIADRTVEEIAATLAVPKSTVSDIIQRGLTRIAQILDSKHQQ